MRLLRDDLIIVPARGTEESNQVKDPLTGAELELGDAELFLVQSLRDPYSLSHLITQLRERFDMERSEDDLHEFLEMLDELGLLRGAEEAGEADIVSDHTRSDSTPAAKPVAETASAGSARPAAGPAGGRGATRGERPAASVGTGPGAEAPPRPERRRTTKRRIPAGRVVRYLLLAGVLILLFLPYRYETGGAAEILPLATRQIYAEQPGVIDQVFFEGGEWVEQGSVLAQMARHRQSKDFRTTEVSIEKQRATIARLETTPSQEELELQKELLKTARLQYAFSAAQAARLKTLYESGGISFDTYDDAVEEMEVEEQRVSEREANLAAVEGQISPYELAAARAEEQRLTEELVYFKERLHRTALHMPIDGRIITMRLKDLQNKFLDDGDLFAEVEDARQVRIKIAVPEADMGEVSEGDAVRLKLWAYPDRFFHSDVSRIYPATAEAEYGTIVEVESLLDNAEGLLRSGMTGHAKIEGREMFVIQAFTRALVRFVLIEVWSWLP